jgi:hypothetical protein
MPRCRNVSFACGGSCVAARHVIGAIREMLENSDEEDYSQSVDLILVIFFCVAFEQALFRLKVKICNIGNELPDIF